MAGTRQHRADLFTPLQARWKDLFVTPYDRLRYDLTSIYFEGQMAGSPKGPFGHSRDQRSDCWQVVIAVVLSPAGFPLAYEIMPGNTSDKATLKPFLEKSKRHMAGPAASGSWTGAFVVECREGLVV